MGQQTIITAMVECPKGFNQKFDYDPVENRFRLSKILPAGLVFPFDFGMIPGTKGADGDPLDIIVISETATSLVAWLIAVSSGPYRPSKPSGTAIPCETTGLLVYRPYPSYFLI
jgi:inorganic pyrophosphatase